MLPLFIIAPLLELIVLSLPRKAAMAKAGIVLGLLLSAAQVVLTLWRPPQMLDASGALNHYFSFGLGMDPISRIMLVTIGLVVFITVLVARATLASPRDLRHFLSVLLVTMIGMNGMCLVRDLFSLYVFLEIVAVSSFILIAIHRGRDALEGAFKYIILSAVASVLMVLAISLLLLTTGSTKFDAVHDALGDSSGDLFTRRLKRVAEECAIGDRLGNLIGELSKGLKQRVGLAHAMIDDPEILVLDEPTSGLDPNQIVEIRDIIRSIGKDKTIVLSTHILSEAEATCDRIVIIDKGRIVADGSTEMLKMGTGQDKTIYLTLKDTGLAQAREVISGVKGVSRIDEEPSAADELRLKLTMSTPDDPREAIYQAIKTTDRTLLELHQEGKSLEKIFRELTQEE